MIFSVRKWAFPHICLLAFAAGIFWRFYYLFVQHPIERFLFSDMKAYADAALRNFAPAYFPSVLDTIHPPGMALVFGFFLHWDPSYLLLKIVQFILSVSTPVFAGLAGFYFYGSFVGWLVLAISSIYFPFIGYSANFLAEGPLIAFYALALCLLGRGLKKEDSPRKFHFFVAAGMAFGLGASFKSIAMHAGVAIGLVLLFWGTKFRETVFRKAGQSLLMGIFLVVLPLSLRCTYLSGGNFCAVANDFSRGLVIVYRDTKGMVRWKTPAADVLFGSPVTYQEGFHDTIEVPFSVLNNKKNILYAWNWIGRHPLGAVKKALTQITYLVSPTTPFPFVDSFARNMARFYLWFFLLFLFVPVLLQGFFSVRRREMKTILLLAPFLTLLLAVMLCGGEPRYRIAHDLFLILPACAFYSRAWEKLTSWLVPLRAHRRDLLEAPCSL